MASEESPLRRVLHWVEIDDKKLAYWWEDGYYYASIRPDVIERARSGGNVQRNECSTIKSKQHILTGHVNDNRVAQIAILIAVEVAKYNQKQPRMTIRKIESGKKMKDE